ncbi:carbohydrate ABC transporter permease [Spirochaeta dissipatitropha]
MSDTRAGTSLDRASQNRKKSGLKMTSGQTEALAAYLFILPFFVIFIVFQLFPIFATGYVSFQRWPALGTPSFSGLRNYNLLMTDTMFWRSVGNTFSIWFLSTVPMLILSLFLALLLNDSLLKGKRFFRMAAFIPNVTSTVAVAIVFSVIFARRYGILNFLLTQLGIDPVNWQGSYIGTHIAIASMVIWRWTGYNAIIFLSGLQSIPRELYESATIDGANKFERLTQITIPMLRPVIVFAVMLSTIGGMQLFAEPLIFGVGSQSQGLTVTLYLYQEAFGRFNFGYAAAVAWMLFFIIVGFALFNSFLTRRIQYVD